MWPPRVSRQHSVTQVDKTRDNRVVITEVLYRPLVSIAGPVVKCTMSFEWPRRKFCTPEQLDCTGREDMHTTCTGLRCLPAHKKDPNCYKLLYLGQLQGLALHETVSKKSKLGFCLKVCLSIVRQGCLRRHQNDNSPKETIRWRGDL